MGGLDAGILLLIDDLVGGGGMAGNDVCDDGEEELDVKNMM